MRGRATVSREVEPMNDTPRDVASPMRARFSACAPSLGARRSRDAATEDSLEDRRDLVRELASFYTEGSPQSATALDQLIQLSAGLSVDTDYDGVLDQIVRAASGLGVAERVLVVMRQGHGLRAVREHGESGAHFPPEDLNHISETLVRRCLRHDTIEVRSNLPTDPELSGVRSISKLQLRSSVCLPLRSSGRAIGVLYLDSRRHLHHSDLAIRILEAFAGHASLCLAHLDAMQQARAKERDLSAEILVMKEHVESRWRRLLIGKSAAWRGVVEQIEIYRDHPHPVLILGETGSGKDLVANALRDAGIRSRPGPLVRLNCTAIPEPLQEAELFGTARGAFTNAKDRRGLVEEAHRGTLFLDEVGDMAPSLQAKMLTFLESGLFYRVGDATIREVDVRIIAATHHPLGDMVNDGSFREDLFYRLKGVRIDVPPLRQRIEDIPLLADHFLATDAANRSLPVPGITPTAMRTLMSYRWPGNVRELRRVMETAFTQAVFRGESIDARHVRNAIQEKPMSFLELGPDDMPERMEDVVSEARRAAVVRALARRDGDTLLAAEDLGVSRQTLYNIQRRIRRRKK
jgi:transcriptional regulator with GAF, ATPase, and Fis domain